MFKTSDGRSFGVYSDSVHGNVCMAAAEDRDYIVAEPSMGFCGEEVVSEGKKWTLALKERDRGMRS